MLISRIAPTPSGYLHLGNVFNFLLTWLYVKKSNGILHLRIDDFDFNRTKEVYAQDIFDTLNWLEIDYNFGSKNIIELKKQYSQTLKTANYKQVLNQLIEKNLVFACNCSRSYIAKYNQLLGQCQYKNYPLNQPGFCMRIKNSDLNYSIIWRKENIPSYHLVSITEDLESQINFIVRGKDLLESTQIQKQIALYLKPNSFSKIKFIHHPLLVEPNGSKLAKSEGSLAIKTLRENGLKPKDIYQKFANWLNQPSTKVDKITDLLDLNM